jgi:hypothetical protein
VLEGCRVWIFQLIAHQYNQVVSVNFGYCRTITEINVHA